MVRWMYAALLLCLLLIGCGTPALPAGERILTPERSAQRATSAATSPASATSTPLPSATPAPPASATSTPLPSATPAPWRFVVLGDTRTAGLKPPQVMYDLVEQARRAEPELVLTVGDMINALDDPESVREQWRHWRAAVEPLGAQHMLVTPGNHDVQRHSWATTLMVEAFPELPTNGPAGLERLAYVFDYRGVRFISLHSEIFRDPHHLGEVQLAWLEEQLRGHSSRYTIVFSHDPAYPVGPHVGNSLDVYPKERDRLWELLREYGATAYIAGHEHLYNHQRIAGVDQIIAGTSGSAIYPGYGGEFYHYLVCEVGEEGIEVVVYDLRGSERDRLVLSR